MTHTIYTGGSAFAEAYAIRDYVNAQDIGESEDQWYETLLSMVSNARFVPISAQPEDGPDGFMYYTVGIPPRLRDDQIEKSYPVAEFEELAEACKTGIGVLFFTELDNTQEPFLRLTMGDMLCYIDHQTLLGAPPEMEERSKLEVIETDDDMLPPVARELLAGFFEHIGFQDVGVATIVHDSLTPSHILVLNILPEEIEPQMAEQILYRVNFFLKPLRRAYLNEFELAQDNFTPLNNQ